MIPFNVPNVTGNEEKYIKEAIRNRHLSGGGPFTKKCQGWLRENMESEAVFLTHSCTAALEMSSVLADIGPGDEVIMPSYTFVSTANAFVMRGAIPVFVDIRPDTLNIDDGLIEAAITERTKAVVPVHYAGIGCEMDAIMEVANRHDLIVIEDAAHAGLAYYKGRSLGSIGQLGTISFHETKNIISGEGGAIMVNDSAFIERAEIVREKGTNRSKFLNGQIDKYSWVDVGSSYLPSEIMAAFLWAQFEDAESITSRRLHVWEMYHSLLADAEAKGYLRRPIVPEYCKHNAHLYYVLVKDLVTRTALIKHLASLSVDAVFHYVPLHSSPAGRKYGRANGELPVSVNTSERVLRLPLWVGLDDKEVSKVVSFIYDFFE